jgi:hypothetical protein
MKKKNETKKDFPFEGICVDRISFFLKLRDQE